MRGRGRFWRPKNGPCIHFVDTQKTPRAKMNARGEGSGHRQTPGMHRRDRSPFDLIPQAATCASSRAGICRRLWRIQADEGPMRHRAQGSALVLTTGRPCRIARFNRRLLPLSIPGRKMSIPGQFCPGMPFYKEWLFPWTGCLQAFHGRASTLSML